MNYLSTYRVRTYLRFLWQSSNQHGVHSPFVYQLVTQCFYNYQFHPAYERLKVQRNDLKILEMPALDEKHRLIRKMLRTSTISLRRVQLLNRLVRYLQIQHALELGTSFGLVSAAMATENKTVISSVEGYSIAAEIARQNFDSWGLNQTQVFASGPSEVLVSLRHSQPPAFDLVYINRHPKSETILDYFEQLLPFVHNESVFIVEDIHSSPKAEVDWETLKKHPKVRVSIDTYKWGLIFLRKEQVKEHFVIRV